MEITKETQLELEAKQKQEYNDWNSKMNVIAKEVVELLRGHQLSVHDFNEVMKVLQQAVGNKLGSLNINFVLNNEDK